MCAHYASETPCKSDNTPKHQPGRVYQRLFWWPFLSETLLMWLNAGRGWNLRCGVLFLSETILITLPSTPPTKHPSNKQGKRSQFVMHTHKHTHTHLPLHSRISVLLFLILKISVLKQVLGLTRVQKHLSRASGLGLASALFTELCDSVT